VPHLGRAQRLVPPLQPLQLGPAQQVNGIAPRCFDCCHSSSLLQLRTCYGRRRGASEVAFAACMCVCTIRVWRQHPMNRRVSGTVCPSPHPANGPMFPLWSPRSLYEPISSTCEHMSSACEHRQPHTRPTNPELMRHPAWEDSEDNHPVCPLPAHANTPLAACPVSLPGMSGTSGAPTRTASPAPCPTAYWWMPRVPSQVGGRACAVQTYCHGW
jgi:hypothetical protein